MLDCYPDTQLALRLWNVYVKSVDPVLKILHIPTVQSTIVETILDPKSAQSSVVALTYAIYFAAVTALCHDDDEPTNLPCEKPVLLAHYKKALDQLLMPTELMKRPELVLLQALAIYAVSTNTGRRSYLIDPSNLRRCFRLVYASMRLAGVFGFSMG